MKNLGKRKVKNSIRTVARGCYCGAICTCYNASSAKAAYTASKAVGWSSADVGIKVLMKIPQNTVLYSGEIRLVGEKDERG